MNILFFGFDYVFEPVVPNVLKCVDVSECSVISIIKPLISDKVNVKWISHDELEYENLNWHEFDPLDDELINSMSGCERIVLKMMDRTELRFGMYSYEQRKKRYLRHLRYWSHYIKKNGIELFVALNLPHMVLDYIIYSLCKKMNIKILMFYRMPTLPNKCVNAYILDDYRMPIKEIEDKYKDLKIKYKDKEIEYTELSTYSKNYFDAYTFKNGRPVAYLNLDEKEARLPRIQRIINTFKTGDIRNIFSTLIRKGYEKFFDLKNKFGKLYEFCLQKDKIDVVYWKYWLWKTDKTARKFYRKVSFNIDESEKFIYLALHYQPEGTTSPLADSFADQFLMIEMLSFCVPDDVFVYVKDHPRHTYNRTEEYYKDASKLRNVKLIRRECDTYELMKKCIAIATATGTAGFEGLFVEKPVLMFGNYFYRLAPSVYHIRTLSQCQFAMKEIMSGRKPTLAEIKIFLKAMEEVTLDCYVNTNYASISTRTDEENIKTVSEALIKNINSIKLFNKKFSIDI